MIIHKELTPARWFEFSLLEQLGNVGSDIERAIAWKQKDNLEYSKKAFERALELLHFTIEDPKNKSRLRELLLTKEALIDHFKCENEYNTTDEQWQKYFFQFAYAAAILKGR